MFRSLVTAASLLVLPLAALLFAQWPLRDLVQAYSTQANDFAQILFAFYMAIAVTAASAEGAHLAAGHAPDEHDTRAARWRAWALAVCIVPWSVFILWTTALPVWRSALQLERFGETLNAGYFLVRAALWLMAALILVEALARLLRRGRPPA